ncbi:hypothetical protein QEG23_002098 [Stenotrophomonas maltophilia]|uniref:Uncharacterized protein n=1 Tax=Stenotrophomonas maltophilia TaxID=40324 RepID=A0AAI9C1U4_STEMA|nr:hypothetical protein [Stenotrophomonas maltophilia]
MTVAFLCVAIAFAAGMIGATPKRAAILGALVGGIAGAVRSLVERDFIYYGISWEEFPWEVLLPAAATAAMAFAVAKLKR